MENKFIEDEIELKEINNIKALYYKVNYPEQKVNEDPVFRRWLESQKKEKGENGIVSYCQNCNLFFYFINENEENETKRICCNDYFFGHFCNYCDQIIIPDSYCCIRGGIKLLFQDNLLNGKYGYKEEIFDCIKFIPIIFFFIFFVNISCVLFVNKRRTIKNVIFSSYNLKDSYGTFSFLAICSLISILYYLIFLIFSNILYIIFLFLVFLRCRN